MKTKHHEDLQGPAMEYDANIPPYVIISCIMVASGGLMHGYNIGITGGITSMDGFLETLFPSVYAKKQVAVESNYCKFDDQKLEAFTSSLYIAGLISTFAASPVTRIFGRKPSMITAGLLFTAGVLVSATVQSVGMLILGRIMLGCATGFFNQAAPIYLSEMAPPSWRGRLNIMLQLNVTIGILCANLVNYGTRSLSWGWRLSLALAGVPATVLMAGSWMIMETPSSLIERGHLERGKQVLCKIRGTLEVDAELKELVQASEEANHVKNPLRSMLTKKNWPPLIVALLMQVFQQLTGINAIMFYSPVLFETVGFGSGAALYSAVITGSVNVAATVISILSVDRFGRRVLLLEAGVQMFISQVLIAVLLGTGLGDGGELGKGAAITTVVGICVFVAAFAWSWGPMGWLIPSEIFPLEIRSLGQSAVVCVNLLVTCVVAQAFLSTLCALRYTIFIAFATCVLLMTAFVFFMLPETKGVPIDAMPAVWHQHRFWGRFVVATNGNPSHHFESALLSSEPLSPLLGVRSH